MASRELRDFQSNLARTEQNAESLRDQIDSVNDIVSRVKSALGLVKTVSEATEKIDKVVDGLEKVANLAGKISPIANLAKRLEDILETVAVSTEQMQQKAGALSNRTEPVKDKLDTLNKAVNKIELDIFKVEQKLNATRDQAIKAEKALKKIAQAPDANPVEIAALAACIDALVAPANDVMERINGSVDAADARLDQLKDLFEPPEFDFGILEDLGEDFADLLDVFDVLAVPFEALEVVIEPIEWALDAIDTIYNFVVAPVLDPILEALGLRALMDEVSDQILSLLPSVDILDPLDGFFDDFAGVLGAIDFDLPEFELIEDLKDFLDLDLLIGGVIDQAGSAVEGLPFDFSLFGILEVKPDHWVQADGATITAGADGGIIFGSDNAGIIIGGVGSDIIIGGNGAEILTNDGIGEAAGVVNFISGGGGNDIITAFGATTVQFDGNIGEYLVSQPETDDGGFPDFIFVDHLAKSAAQGGDGRDKIFFDSDTSISFGALPVFNLEEFLLGYQAASPGNADLFGDRDENGVPDVFPRRDFLIGGTSEFLGAPNQANRLEGYDLDDFLSGGPGADILLGGRDNDYLIGGPGEDFIDGGEGEDTTSFVDLTDPIVISDPTGVVAPFGSDFTRGAQLYLDKTALQSNNLGLYLTDIVINVENVIGSDFEEIIFGNENKDNIILGEAGQDVLRGVGAGELGNLIVGGLGKDAIIIDSGKDQAFGEDGDDVFYVALQSQFPSDGNFIDGGLDNDLINYSNFEDVDIFGFMNNRVGEVLFGGVDFGDPLNLALTMAGGFVEVDAAAGTVTRTVDATGSVAVDRFQNVEAIIGSPGDDRFIAGETDDPIQLHGGEGDDRFLGVGWGIDSIGRRDFSAEGNGLFGNNGADLFELHGSHEVHGGDGIDTLDLTQSEDGFWVVDLTGLDWFSGSSIPLLGHFEQETDLPRVQDLFLRPNQINNPDPRPAFFDPSDPAQFALLPNFHGPLNDGQEISGIEQIRGSERRDILLGGRDVQFIDGKGGDDYLALRFDSNPQALSNDYPDPFNQLLLGGDGDDVLVGHFGAETIFGQDGDDIIDLVANVFDDGEISLANGGAGADLFYALDYNVDGQSPGIQRIVGGEHTFEVTLADGTVEVHEFQDAVDFGDGEVSQLNELRADGVRVDLSGQASGFPGFQARGIVLEGIENIFGTRFDDEIFGDEFYNVLIGRAGNDDLRGGAGDDILSGGAGDDKLRGEAGNDKFLVGSGDGNNFNGRTEITGGDGLDTISYQFLHPDGRGATVVDPFSIGSAVVQLHLGVANFIPDPDSQQDSSSVSIQMISAGLSDVENATGGRGDDDLSGDIQANVLIGDDGDDDLFGREGDDILIVGDGDDTANGQDGDDIIFGASGTNTFDGGDGTDRLDFTSNTLGLAFDLDTGLVTADYDFSVHVFADHADDGGTLAERAAHTKQSGSNDSGAIGVRSITAEDVFKIENPAFADKFLHVEVGFVRSTIGSDGLALGSFAFVEQSEVRSHVSTATGFESFVAGAGDDSFVYGTGVSAAFTGLIDGSDGFDIIDLRPLGESVTFSQNEDVFSIDSPNVAIPITLKNIERAITIDGNVDLLNALPTARNDVAATDEDTAIILGDLLNNDDDPNPGNVLSISAVDYAGTLGSVTLLDDRTISYDPAIGLRFLGEGVIIEDTFSYTVSDGAGGEATASVTVTVTGLDSDRDVLTGGLGNDVLNGGIGADELNSEGGDDLLTGGPDFDGLNGGLGIDTAVYFGDINDHRLIITPDLVLVSSSVDQSGDNPGAPAELPSVEFDILRDIEIVRFDDGDFDLVGYEADISAEMDGQDGADIIFKHAAGHHVIINGANPNTVDGVGRAPDTLHGIADLTGDSIADIIFERSNGTYFAFDAKNDAIQNFGGTRGDFAGLLDTDGDGVSELLLQRPNGAFFAVDADGSFAIGYGRGDHTLLAVGDFDGIAGDDLLFERPDGGYVWSSGQDKVTHGVPRPAADTFIGGGDFDGDGDVDFLFERGSNGAKAAFDETGAIITGFGRGVQDVAAIGDFNGDTIDDILFADAANRYVAVDGFDKSIIGAFVYEGDIIGTGDYRLDTRDEIVGRDAAGVTTTFDAEGTLIEIIGAPSLTPLALDPLGLGQIG